MLTAADFEIVPEFRDQAPADLAWLAETTEERTHAKGTRPFESGDVAEEMFIVLDGSFQIFTAKDGGQRLPFATIRAGEISGLLPFSRMETFAGEGVVVEAVRIAVLHKRHFWEMMERMPEVGQRLVARMTDRVRETSRLDQQREKMLALGKLSAGLAHELNNPAAAIARGASDLGERFASMMPLVSRLVGHGLSPDQVEAARAAFRTCTAPSPGSMSALDRSAREDELADWLDDHGVPHAYMVAEVLAEEGATPSALDQLAAEVPEGAVGDMVLWIEKGMAVERLVGEIERSAGRISELVASVKSYSHMDRAPARQATDLREGIDQTLTMLGHSVRAKNLTVERDYADDLPEVCVFPGEINQVWTNLVDNAIDAADEGGTLAIRTWVEGQLVCVALTNDGDGIPEETLARIWEPFFTTKAPGAGTGLGLDVVQRIVAQHSGRIDVVSEPGATTFTVCLPIDAPAPSPEGA
ncbi:sensor histidine kinase [Rubrivirga sp. IMCC43871]|uniref:sensor histidine kinase n=1 Tax=Rubrivirga sp. IMCC43871 TaxID=3391575 RepID=UPI00398FED5A